MRLVLHVDCNSQANALLLMQKRPEELQLGRYFGLNAHFECDATSIGRLEWAWRLSADVRETANGRDGRNAENRNRLHRSRKP